MRKVTTIVAAMLLSVATFAQVPQGFSYQAVVRDAQNAIVANQPVEVTVTILQGADAASATAVFSEKHSATTNANGLFTLTIGSVDAAKFSAINWAGGNLFLKTESAYGTATTQLLSVPFAMYAAKAASADIDLSEYAKKADIPVSANLEGYAKTADIAATYATKTDLAAKVDKEEGKGLSTNDFTDALKSKLENDVLTGQDITSKVDKEEGKGLSTNDFTDALKSKLESQVLTEHQDITGKVDKEEGKGLSTNDFTDALKTKLESQVLTEHQDITGKVDKVEGKGLSTNDFTNDLKSKLESEVLTQHQSLDGYYSKTEVEALLDDLKTVINKQGNTIALMNGDVVDLGLTSGNLWATRNLGATNPQDYGDYYAWGEVETKSNYSWDTYKYGTSSTTLTKYNTLEANGTVDNKTVLEAEDDDATATLGAGWAMPTIEEFRELYNECYWEWTTDYNGTGVVGYIVYKSADKTKDKRRNKGSDHEYSTTADTHVFLPAAGDRDVASLGDVGSFGHYWSASLNTSYPNLAHILYFSSGGVNPTGLDYRYYGFSVRPVRRP
ncbi:MAG: hypothetical protein J6T12_03395 [Salinivirgaceae bacterium]|nr:hypothetical protein [Salinivirgaceae bacterium]